jgi:hypothetical protein
MRIQVVHKSKVVADYYAKAWHPGGTLAHAAQVTIKKNRKVDAKAWGAQAARSCTPLLRLKKALLRLYFSLKRALIELY